MLEFGGTRYHYAPRRQLGKAPAVTRATCLAWIALLAWMLAGCTGQQVLNTLTSERGMHIAPDLPYGEMSGPKLDVYMPEGVKDAPVVVFFYGARWTSGDKEQYRFVAQGLTSRGIIAVIPNVRQYPQVRFPEFVEDAARAVRWTRDHIADYGGSPTRLYVMGHSSGAHIAAMLALDEEFLKGVGGSRAWLRGMIGLAGPYDFLPLTAPDLRDIFGPPDRFAFSQPVFYVDGQNPPLLLLHGENDDIVEVRNTNNLAAAVARAGGPVETVIYPRMSHSLLVGALGPMLRSTSDVLDHVVDFIMAHADERPGALQTEIRAVPLEIEQQPIPEPEAPPPAPIAPPAPPPPEPMPTVPVSPPQ
jgi:acetyl esterase/lipase